VNSHLSYSLVSVVISLAQCKTVENGGQRL
jgi:hypothetical protein